MFRSAILLVMGVLITAFMAIVAVALSALSGRRENAVHNVARLWARLLLCIAGVKAEISGLGNILSDKPQIFMANHQSGFDVFIMLKYIPVQFRWIAKKELFSFPIFGSAMRRAGYISIDRENRAYALRSLDEGAEQVRKGKSLMTFPEGTRSRDGKIKPFKKGLFYLAIQSGVPIVPISIAGSREIMQKRSLRIIPGKISIFIDKPIDVCGYDLALRHELIDRVQSVISTNFYRLSSERERE